MAKWEPNTVKYVVNKVESEYVLPVIQRDFVWTEEKMELLFDSLLKGNSFGSIIVIQEEKGKAPLFEFRQFTTDGSISNSQHIDILTHEQRFVIDGQQRLQTFYIGLKGTYRRKHLFFDLYSNYKKDFEFDFEISVENLPQKLQEEREIKDCFWYPVKELFNQLSDSCDDDVVADLIISTHKIVDDTKKLHIRKNIKAFYKSIFQLESVGIAIVMVDKTTYTQIENRQKIVDLFRRLNDGGTKLSALDLVASTLKGFDYRMEGFLREMKEEFSDIGLTPENLIKLIFLLQDNSTKEMLGIDVGDADFAISKKDRIKNTMFGLRKFLENSKLYDYYKDKNRSFIPLFVIAYHIFHKDIPDKQLANLWNNFETSNQDFMPIKQWLCNSLLNGVFRSRGAGWVPYKTGIKKMFDVIRKSKNKIFPKDDLIKVYVNHPIHYTSNYTVDNLDNLDRDFLFYLMYEGKIQIRINDIDHIMSRNILEQLNKTAEDINSVKNFQLLDFNTNRGAKKGKQFKKWLKDPNCVANKDAYLAIHLIPKDESLWEEEKFEEFIKARGKLILERINKYVD